MIVLGNLLLGLAALVFLLLKIETFGKAAPGGDTGVGWGWVVVISHGAMLVCFALVALIIGSKGGWDWVGATGGARFLWVTCGLALTIFGSMFLTSRDGMRTNLWLWELLSWPIPVLLFAGLAILLNGGTAYRMPLLLAVGIGAMPFGLLVLNSLKRRFELYADVAKTAATERQTLREIETCDLAKDGIARLLPFTHYKQPETLRNAALAKIHSRPDWPQQLAEGLTKDWAPGVFAYMGTRFIEDKDKPLFAKSLHAGILTQAAAIREALGKVTLEEDLYPVLFHWEVEAVRLTLENFEGNGENYRPEMQTLRDAFDTPCKVQKPAFTCLPDLDSWLQAH